MRPGTDVSRRCLTLSHVPQVGIGVSCSADRQAMGKITKDGVFLEQLETNPAKYLPDVTDDHLSDDVVQVDLNKPMAEIRKQLSQYPIKTRLSLTGPLIVARDIAHAKLKERIDAGQGLPQYFKDHIVYYAGPAKTPEGMPSGSFGPTTAGRMDAYVDLFQKHGGSMVMYVMLSFWGVRQGGHVRRLMNGLLADAGWPRGTAARR
jgi:fumarate hydratase class I